MDNKEVEEDNKEVLNPVVPEKSVDMQACKDIAQEPAMGSSSDNEEPYHPGMDYQTIISRCDQKLSKVEGLAKELEKYLDEAMQNIAKISLNLKETSECLSRIPPN